MLTGELPFKGDHEAAVLYGIINGEPELLATRRGDVPKSLDKIIAKMLAKRPDLRYESMIELTTDLNMIRASTRPMVTARSRIRFGLAASLIALAAVALVILKPTIFGLRENVNSPTEVEALAVMYFDNLADRDDPDRWGEIVTNLLITNLSETEHIRVVSSQRLYDILKAQGKQGAKTIDRDTAIDVATAAGVKWMLLGSIITQHPNLVITSHLVDTESGEVEATQRVAGGPDEQIYPLIDKLTMEVKSDLGLPGLARNEKEMSIKDVTTSSTEAYRHYLEGMDYHNLGLREKGKESFEKALACDSTYAMAYYQLAGFLMPGTGRDKRAAIDEALRYSDRVTRKERLLIQCQSYYLAGEITRSIEILEVVAREYQEEKEVYMQLGWCYAKNRRDIRSAIPYYLRVLELDPLSKRAYNQLAYFYSHVGVPDSSVWAINKLIALVPNEPSPYDTRGDLYKWDGEIQKAMDSYRKSYSLEPEFFWALESLGLLHLHKGEVETARRQFQEILGKSNATARGRARLCMAMIPLYKGKLEEAQEVLSHGIGSDEMEGYEGAAYLDKLHFSSLVYARRGDYDRANTTFNKLLDAHRRVNPENLLDWQYDHAYLLSMQKRFSEAEEISREMRASVVDTTNLELMYRYWLARGLIELERGDFDSACHYLQEAQKTVKWFFVRYPMALAYLKAGRLSDAVREFERILERYERLTLYRMFDPVWAVTAHYYLGVAYEESGWNNKAIEQYGEFLDTWKDADPGIPEVEDAKGRLTKLKSKE
jgi:tetratricopeptide (TPR) repeat protein